MLSVGLFFCAFAGGTRTIDGDVLTYDIPSGVTYVENELIPDDVSEVIKKGEGTLEVKAGNSARKSALTVEIMEGYVKTAISTDPFGGEKTTIKVARGAALWYTGANPGQKTRLIYKMEIAGDGPDGKGAFYRTGSSGGDCLITNLKLTDGATIGGDKKFGVRYTDLNSHTLTNKVVGSIDESFMYASHEYGSHVKNPGNIVQLSNSVTIDGLKSWDGVSDGNSWTVAKASCLDFFTQASGIPFPWEVKAEANPTLRVFKDAEMLRGITGVNSGLSLTFSGLYKFETPRVLTIRGAVTNFVLTKNDAVLKVAMLTNDHYFSRMDINAGAIDIVGGERQKLVNAWNTSHIKSGGALLLEDAGDVITDMGYLTVCNPSFATDGLVPRLDVVGDTRWSASVRGEGGNSYLYSMVYLGQRCDVYNTESVNASGWGVASIRDGAVVTNAFKVGTKGAGALTLENAELYQCNDSLDVATDSAACYGYFGSSNAVFTTAGNLNMASAAGSEAHYVQHGGFARNRNSGVMAGGAGYSNFYLGDGAKYDTNTTFPNDAEADRNKSYFHLGYNNFTDRPATGGESVLTVDDNSLLEVRRINLLSRAGSLSQVNLNRGGCLSALQMWYCENHVKPENSRLLFSFNGGKIKYNASWSQTASVDFLGDAPDRIVLHGLGGEIEVADGSNANCKVPLERPTGKSIKSIALPDDEKFVEATKIGPAKIIIEGSGEGASAFAPFDARRGILNGVVVTSPGTGYDDDTKAYIRIPALPDQMFECEVELMEEIGGDFVKSGKGNLSLYCTNTYAGATVVKGGMLYANSHWAFPSNTLLRVEGGSVQCNNYKNFFEAIEGWSGNVYFYLRSSKTVDVQRLSLFAGANVTLGDGNYTMNVHGAWKVKAADIAAVKSESRIPGYSCNVNFMSGATIEFDGTEGLVKENSPYVLCALPEGKSFTGRPVLVNQEALGERWAFSMSGSVMSLKYRNPFAVIFR